jgi:pilus assembly protein CpaE
MTAELPSVRNAVRYMEHLGKLGYSPNSIQVVLNRHSKKGPLSDERVEKALGRPVSFRVPNSYTEVIRAINAGAPIASASRSDFSAAIQTWANDLVHSKDHARKPEAKAAGAAQSRGGVLGIFSR